MEDEEELLTAETSELDGADFEPDGENAEREVADPETEESEEAERGDVQTEGAEKPAADEEKKVMDKSQRSVSAAMRREKERQEAEEKAYQKGKLEAFKGIINPFTNEEINDELDAEEYRIMLQIQKKGGDPIADYSAELKSNEREVHEKREKETIQADFMAKDCNEFIASHPDLDIAKLFGDKKFVRFSEKRLGKESMASIYEDWLYIAGEFEQTTQEKAKKIAAKAASSPGRLGGETSTKVSYEDMADADFDKKLAAVLSGRERI